MSGTETVSGRLLVATKLHVPQPREGLVARPELVARLISGRGHRLALVSAPAGWGKTVLLSQWHASEQETRSFAWVSLDPAGAPRLVEEALRLGMIAPLAGLLVVRREVMVRTSRIDLLLTGEVLCEVKSVGAARVGIARFPDAPTERGVRHVKLLTRLASPKRSSRAAPRRCAIVLCAQRGDVRAIAPDEEIDPDFARALKRAAKAGVVVCGLRCAATLAGMEPLAEVPVLL